MLDTRRVQRLTHKPKSDFLAKATQAFGGGMLQLKDEAWKLLQNVFDIDYMGAAEYEFGALPRCLSNIVSNISTYEAFEFVIKAKDIQPNWERERILQHLRRAEIEEAKKKGEKPPRKNTRKLIEKANQTPITNKTIYVIGRKDMKSDIEELIRKMGKRQVHSKNGHFLERALDPITEYDKKYIGWLDLDNEYFFFTDQEMFKGAADLFLNEGWAPSSEEKSPDPS